jgi:hypothetical protein
MFLERRRQERQTEHFPELTFALQRQHGIFSLDRSSENSYALGSHGLIPCTSSRPGTKANMLTAGLGVGQDDEA